MLSQVQEFAYGSYLLVWCHYLHAIGALPVDEAVALLYCLELFGTVMEQDIGIGDWVDTKSYGKAVCTGFIGARGEWVEIRYKAFHCNDRAEIWVQNTEHKDYVTWAAKSDKIAQHALTLKGPYGID